MSIFIPLVYHKFLITANVSTPDNVENKPSEGSCCPNNVSTDSIFHAQYIGTDYSAYREVYENRLPMFLCCLIGTITLFINYWIGALT